MASVMMRGASALVSRPCAPRVVFRSAVVPVKAPIVQRGALHVVAAEPDKKAEKKAVPRPVKRAKLAETRRMYNKSRKSACATRIKKVVKLADQLVADIPKAEAAVPDLERLISEAFCEIDKAVVKGILHKNNGARKKARCSRYKKKVLLAAGLWNPPADHADYKTWLRLNKRGAAAATAAASKSA